MTREEEIEEIGFKAFRMHSKYFIVVGYLSKSKKKKIEVKYPKTFRTFGLDFPLRVFNAETNLELYAKIEDLPKLQE